MVRGPSTLVASTTPSLQEPKVVRPLGPRESAVRPLGLVCAPGAMGKSIRSKVKRKHRAERRAKMTVIETKRLAECRTPLAAAPSRVLQRMRLSQRPPSPTPR